VTTFSFTTTQEDDGFKPGELIVSGGHLTTGVNFVKLSTDERGERKIEFDAKEMIDFLIEHMEAEYESAMTRLYTDMFDRGEIKHVPERFRYSNHDYASS
jgi:hypothetical protein